MQYSVNACDPILGENYTLTKKFGQQLIENCDIIVTEVVRKSARNLEAYIEMSSTLALNTDYCIRANTLVSKLT